MDKIIAKKIKYIFIVTTISISIFTINQFIRTHPTVGEWQNVEKDLKLSLFKDKTAIYDYGKNLGKVSCEWSEKDSNLIVLICKLWIGEGENVMTFKTDSSPNAGHLEGSEKTTMRRIEVGDSGKKEIAQYPPSLWEKSESIAPLADNFNPPLLDDSESHHSAKEAIFPSALRDQIATDENESFVTGIQTQWESDPDAGNRQAIEGIIGDNTIPPELKKAVLRQYALNRYVPRNLKERYIQKTAANDTVNNTVEDQKRQDWVVASLLKRRAQMDYEQRQHDLENNQTR